MFEIEYKGANTVVISTKKTTLVVDPRLSVVGLKDIKIKDEVQLVTEPRFKVENREARIIIDGPGEYEVGDFAIRGAAAQRHIDSDDSIKRGTIYRVECGDVRLGVFGNISAKLSDEQLEAIGIVDILLLPIGGSGYTLDPTDAITLIRNIEPKVVIPVHYADSGLRYEVPQEALDAFTTELGAPCEEVSRYKLKGAMSIPSSLTVVAINRT
ncbi:MAG: MBL fold metallo-hydrolase [Candidatus Saccharimonas aalborgensis]